MTTYRTGNPIGSKDPRDLYDNAENFDAAINDVENPSFEDRFGRQRTTLKGYDDQFQQFLINSGYENIGDYGPSLEITARNQIFWRAGELYRAGASLELPYTTTGDWATEEELFVAVGDDSLRQDISRVEDANPGAAHIGMSSVHFSDIPAFLEGSGSLIGSKSAAIVGTFAPEIGVGGIFYWDGGIQKSQHNGGTTIDPDRPFPSDWSDEPSREAWFAKNSTTGQGCWVRFGIDTALNVKWFGAVGDGVFDDTESFQATVNSLRDWGDVGASSVYIPTGEYLLGDLDIPSSKIGCMFQGDGILQTKLISTGLNIFLVRAEDQRWKNLAMVGLGITTEDSVFVVDHRNNTLADVDWEFDSCHFSEVERVGHCFGRGVTFKNCTSFNVRTSWIRADFPDDYVPIGDDNQTLEAAFRGFVFDNNRRHYDPCYFLENTGENQLNIDGVMIRNNWIEGGGRLVLGYLRNAVITGNNSYHKSTPYQTLNLTGLNNVVISGNSFSCFPDSKPIGDRYFATFLESEGEVRNLTITSNNFKGLQGNLLFLKSSFLNENIKIESNTYVDCFHDLSNKIIRSLGGRLEKVVIREVVDNNTNDSAWIPILTDNLNPGATLDSIIELKVAGGTLKIDNLPGHPSISHIAVHGTYVGNAAPGGQRVVVGYSPRFVKVNSPGGNISVFKSRHNITETPEIEFVTDGFFVRSQLNESGAFFVYETS